MSLWFLQTKRSQPHSPLQAHKSKAGLPAAAVWKYNVGIIFSHEEQQGMYFRVQRPAQSWPLPATVYQDARAGDTWRTCRQLWVPAILRHTDVGYVYAHRC